MVHANHVCFLQAPAGLAGKSSKLMATLSQAEKFWLNDSGNLGISRDQVDPNGDSHRVPSDSSPYSDRI